MFVDGIVYSIKRWRIVWIIEWIGEDGRSGEDERVLHQFGRKGWTNKDGEREAAFPWD